MRTLLAGLALYLALAASAHAEPLRDGFAALKQGNYVKALSLWQPLAEKGNAKAQFALGILYDKSFEHLRDHAKAARWYKKSAEQGNASAQHNLGRLYDNGWGVPKDDTQAVKWYSKAADQGRAAAQHKLGGKFELGQGVAVDEVQAYMWYSLAADQGIKAAFDDRKIITQLLTEAQITKAKRLIRRWRKKRGKK